MIGLKFCHTTAALSNRQYDKWNITSNIPLGRYNTSITSRKQVLNLLWQPSDSIHWAWIIHGWESRWMYDDDNYYFFRRPTWLLTQNYQHTIHIASMINLPLFQLTQFAIAQSHRCCQFYRWYNGRNHKQWVNGLLHLLSSSDDVRQVTQQGPNIRRARWWRSWNRAEHEERALINYRRLWIHWLTLRQAEPARSLL